jgi:hypothetical protein
MKLKASDQGRYDSLPVAGRKGDRDGLKPGVE